MKRYELTVDVLIDFDETFQIKYNQNDKQSATLNVTLTNNNELIDLTGRTVVLYCRRIDNAVYQATVTVIDPTNGLIEVTIPNAALVVPGIVTCQFEITSADNSVAVTSEFQVESTKAVNSNAILPPTEVTLVQQLLARIAAMESVINVQEKTVSIPDTVNGRVTLFGTNGGIDTKKWNNTTNQWESV